MYTLYDPSKKNHFFVLKMRKALRSTDSSNSTLIGYYALKKCVKTRNQKIITGSTIVSLNVLKFLPQCAQIEESSWRMKFRYAIVFYNFF